MISCLVLPRYSRKTAPSSEGILYHVVLCLIFVGYIPIKKIIAYFCGPGGKKKGDYRESKGCFPLSDGCGVPFYWR